MGMLLEEKLDTAVSALVDAGLKIQNSAYGILDIPFVLSALDAAGASRVLDIGTGEGSFITAVAAARPGIDFVAIDHNETLIAAAQNGQCRGGPGNIEFAHRSFDKDFDLGVFDVVLLRFCLEHAPDPQPILNDIYRRLRRGGRVVLIEEYWFDSGLGDPVWEKFRLEMLKTFNKIGADPFVPRHLARWLQSAGFASIDSKLVMYSPVTIGYQPFRDLVLGLPAVLRGLYPDTWGEPQVDELAGWLEQRVRTGAIDPFITFAHVVAIK